MRFASHLIVFGALGLSLTSAICAAQAPSPKPLTLEEALKLAKDRNGNVRAAYYDVESAKSGVGQSLAAFFPSVTPVYQYISDRSSVQTPVGKAWQQSEGGSSAINSTWRILDAGQRDFEYRASLRNEASSRANALQTLRTTLFGVYSQYIESLRSQELLKVNQATVDRANAILEQTRMQVQVGDVAAKDILQAQADALNAQVGYLTAKNSSTNALASLKSIIGWDFNQALPPLAPVDEPGTPTLPPLDQLVKSGISQRADLVSARRAIEALHFNKLIADRNAGPTFTLDAGFDKIFSPDSLEARTLTFTISAPLFDGGFSRSRALQAKYQFLSAEANYVQQERQARAEIEAAYATDQQNAERIKAAKSALLAAQENYKAASESQKAGASTLIDVLTAQVSLATAESNAIQALYDFILSDVNLKLVTGAPVPGEM